MGAPSLSCSRSFPLGHLRRRHPSVFSSALAGITFPMRRMKQGEVERQVAFREEILLVWYKLSFSSPQLHAHLGVLALFNQKFSGL